MMDPKAGGPPVPYQSGANQPGGYPPHYPPQAPPHYSSQTPPSHPPPPMQAPRSIAGPPPKIIRGGNIFKGAGAVIIYIVLYSIGAVLLLLAGIFVIPILWDFLGTSTLLLVIPVAIVIVIFFLKDSQTLVSKELEEQNRLYDQAKTGVPPKPAFPPLSPPVAPSPPPPYPPQYPPQGPQT